MRSTPVIDPPNTACCDSEPRPCNPSPCARAPVKRRPISALGALASHRRVPAPTLLLLRPSPIQLRIPLPVVHSPDLTIPTDRCLSPSVLLRSCCPTTLHPPRVGPSRATAEPPSPRRRSRRSPSTSPDARASASPGTCSSARWPPPELDPSQIAVLSASALLFSPRPATLQPAQRLCSA